MALVQFRQRVPPEADASPPVVMNVDEAGTRSRSPIWSSPEVKWE